MRRIFTVFFIFIVGFVHAQDLTGVWQGHFRSNNSEVRSLMFDARYKFEVQLAQRNKSIEAITYSYLSSIFYGKADAKGTINPKTGKVLIQEGKLLEMRMTTGGGVCTMTCFLQYSKSADEEFLEGSFVSMDIKDSSNCGRGTILLRKVPNSDFYKEPFLVKREREKEEEKIKVPAPEEAPAVVKKNPAAVKKTGPAKTPVTKPGKPLIAAAKPPAVMTGPGTGLNKTGNSKVAGTAVPAVVKKPASSPAIKNSGKPGPGVGPATTARVKPPVAKGITPSLAKIEHRRDSVGQIPSDTGAGLAKRMGPMITPAVLKSRSNELVRSITVNTNEVTLNIYDDGAIDHDTISVYLDKKQVISHAMLTDRAIVLTLHLDGTDNYHELVMVAENEGEIPPNTSLMIVKAGDKEYEVRITSTEQKNAVVIFKYEKSAK
ncbi:MAG TPA: hypothetical protein VK563_02310 [Puia sp.]|nr:hypothetical protein [Puia sp.]